MDSWIGGYTNMYLQFQNDEPLISPIDAGSQGYLGAETACRQLYRFPHQAGVLRWQVISFQHGMSDRILIKSKSKRVYER